jgi:hypothetical protein
MEVIWVKGEQDYFCGKGWTEDAVICLSGKSAAENASMAALITTWIPGLPQAAHPE